MADMHTPLPWSIKNRQDTVEIIGADGVAVARTSWHNSLRRPYPLRAEAAANMALIVAAVNAPSQDAETVKALREALEPFAFVLDEYDPSDDSDGTPGRSRPMRDRALFSAINWIVSDPLRLSAFGLACGLIGIAIGGGPVS